MSTDLAVFLVVVASRLLIPLLILRFPLPAILAALVIDAADQTIFQLATDLDLSGYQGYDKALDIYYLAIAYLSTMRNWRSPLAAAVAAGLWYYRLVGVALFEFFQVRALLLIFPNTFEYYFIAYEAVRLAWDPRRLTRSQIIRMVVVIWVFVKLPQEWWIHIAQLDVTDFVKRDLLGVPVDSSWGTALGENLWFVAILVGLAALIVFVVRRAIDRAPEPDWPVSVDVDDHLGCPEILAPLASVKSWAFVEKVVLTSLIVMIFAEVLPGRDATVVQIVWSVGVTIAANVVVSQWLISRGSWWAKVSTQFVTMVAVNIAIAVAYIVLLRRSDQPINEGALLFFLLLLTLIVTLYDRYRPVRVDLAYRAARHEAAEEEQ